MKKKKEKYSVLKSRRRTLILCFIGWIMCYLITILADYIVAIAWDYFNATEVFCVKLVIWVLCTWIGIKEIENMDFSNEGTFMPE